MSVDTDTNAAVPRDPSHYHPSTHAKQMSRDRGISFSKAAETISDGEVRRTHKPKCKLFVKEFAGDDYPVGVVANVEDGHILTVEWRTADEDDEDEEA